MKRVTLIALAAILTACGSIETEQPIKLEASDYEDIYYSMPQLLFEDLCIKHPQWNMVEMAQYYVDNRAELDKIYQE